MVAKTVERQDFGETGVDGGALNLQEELAAIEVDLKGQSPDDDVFLDVDSIRTRVAGLRRESIAAGVIDFIPSAGVLQSTMDQDAVTVLASALSPLGITHEAETISVSAGDPVMVMAEVSEAVKVAGGEDALTPIDRCRAKWQELLIYLENVCRQLDLLAKGEGDLLKRDITDFRDTLQLSDFFQQIFSELRAGEVVPVLNSFIGESLIMVKRGFDDLSDAVSCDASSFVTAVDPSFNFKSLLDGLRRLGVILNNLMPYFFMEGKKSFNIHSFLKGMKAFHGEKWQDVSINNNAGPNVEFPMEDLILILDKLLNHLLGPNLEGLRISVVFEAAYPEVVLLLSHNGGRKINPNKIGRFKDLTDSLLEKWRAQNPEHPALYQARFGENMEEGRVKGRTFYLTMPVAV